MLNTRPALFKMGTESPRYPRNYGSTTRDSPDWGMEHSKERRGGGSEGEKGFRSEEELWHDWIRQALIYWVGGKSADRKSRTKWRYYNIFISVSWCVSRCVSRLCVIWLRVMDCSTLQVLFQRGHSILMLYLLGRGVWSFYSIKLGYISFLGPKIVIEF